jgi:uncharacterized membrane protein YdbT with pleckstrin-like domain
MGYVDQNLLPNEKVLYRAKLHWVIFIAPVLFLVCGFLSFLVFPNSSNNSSFPTALCASSLFFLSAVITAIKVIIVSLTTEFAITNRRVIAKTGFIRRHSLELLLSKIESIHVDQTILGRILDFGTVIVTGTGGTQESFQSIAAPGVLRLKVNAQLLPQ